MNLSPLHIDGVSFADQAGRKLTYCGFSEFRLLDRFLRGEDVEPIFADRMDVLSEVRTIAAHTGDGAWLLPVLRVLGMMDYLCQLHPQDHGDYYTSVRALVDFAAEHGFYVDFDVFADAQIVMPSKPAQQAHWANVCAALRGCPTVLLSLGNEYQKNGFDPSEFQKPDGLLCSRGSSTGDVPPYKPAWDYSKFHGRRDGLKGFQSSLDLAWMVKRPDDWGNHDQGWGLNQPVIHDEPIGAADDAQDGRRSNLPSVFYRLAWEAAAWGAGGTYHSDCGIQSTRFTPRQRECAQTWCMGLSKCDPAQRFAA